MMHFNNLKVQSKKTTEIVKPDCNGRIDFFGLNEAFPKNLLIYRLWDRQESCYNLSYMPDDKCI